MEGWRARRTWTQAFFVDRYGDDDVEVMVRYTHDGGREHETMNLREYVASFATARFPDPKRPPYLVHYNALHRHPELVDDLGRLPFCPNFFELLPRVLPRRAAYSFGWKNVLIGPRNAVYRLHTDQFGLDGVVMQFQGRKRFVLYPPNEGPHLYFGEIDADEPDLEKYPRFAQARGRLEGILHPGDLVYVPRYWWHQVTSLDDSLSALFDMVHARNVRDVLTEIVATPIARRILHQRSAPPQE